MRVAYQAASLLAERDSIEVVQAWFQGLNPALGTARRLGCCAKAPSTGSGNQVLAAARQFAAVG